MASYAFEVGDKIYVNGQPFIIAGFRKMIGQPMEYCLHTSPSPEVTETWMTVPEINAWLDVDSEPVV